MQNNKDKSIFEYFSDFCVLVFLLLLISGASIPVIFEIALILYQFFDIEIILPYKLMLNAEISLLVASIFCAIAGFIFQRMDLHLFTKRLNAK